MLENIFKNVLDMSLSGSFLIVAVLIARVLLRKSSKLFRKILWGLVALKLIIPFSFESTLSLVPHQSEYVPESTAFSANATAVATDSGFDLGNTLLFVWLGVFVLLAVYATISFFKLRYRISDAVLLEGNIFQSEKIESPFVFGFLKPKIYVSYDIKGENLDYVLKHEKTHIKYFDHITKFIGFAVLCVHWFNPLVWVSYALFCKDVELACDEAVVKDMTEENRKGYALALCNIGINKARISACPVAFGEVSIKERVKSALSYKKIGKIAVVLSVVLCVTVAVCFMTKPEAEATENKENPVVEETTIPTTEAVTEPTTEPSTEQAAEPATEETVAGNNNNNLGEYIAFEYNKKDTPVSEATGEKVDAAYNSLQKGHSFNEDDADSAVAFDGKVVVETTKAPETEKSDDAIVFEPIPVPTYNYNYNNSSYNNSYSSSYNNSYNNQSNNSSVIVWDPAETNYNPAYQNTPSPYKPGFENNCWVGWDYN